MEPYTLIHGVNLSAACSFLMVSVGWVVYCVCWILGPFAFNYGPRFRPKWLLGRLVCSLAHPVCHNVSMGQ